MADVIQEIVFDEADFQEIYDDISLNFQQAEYRDELDDFRDIIHEIHADWFALAIDPNGSSWPPLAAATIHKKKSEEILVETGRLRRSLTTKGGEDQIIEITNRGLAFGTSVPYSVFNQRGTRTIPQRAHVGLNIERVEELTETITKSASDKLRKVA